MPTCIDYISVRVVRASSDVIRAVNGDIRAIKRLYKGGITDGKEAFRVDIRQIPKKISKVSH